MNALAERTAWNMQHRLLGCCIATTAVLALTASSAMAQGQVTGTVQTLDCPGATLTVALDINDSGKIVGRCTVAGKMRGFLFTKGTGYDDGSWVILDFPGATSTEAWGINEQGDVVGFYYLPGDPLYHGFLRRPNGDYELIDRNGAMNTMPEDISDAGYAVGCVHNNGLMHAWVWNDGEFVSTEAARTIMHTGVNESGTVVGWEFTPPAGNVSYILSGVDRIEFGYPDTNNTQAWGLNQSGDVVGWYGATASSRGFLRLHDGTFMQIGVAGATWTRAFGINETGDIVGGFAHSGTHGFVLVQ